MSQARTTIIDLSRLSLAHGEGKRMEVPVELDPFELGGQTYLANPASPTVRLEISRPSGGFAFRLQLPGPPRGPVHALPRAAPSSTSRSSAREVHQPIADDAELHSPYVDEDELDIGRWAHDATLLALPDPDPLPPRLRRPLPRLRRAPSTTPTPPTTSTPAPRTPAGPPCATSSSSRGENPDGVAALSAYGRQSRHTGSTHRRIAGRQHGVVSHRQLLRRRAESGCDLEASRSEGACIAFIGASTPWGIAALSIERAWMAAVLACGDGAVLSHRSAAALWGICWCRARRVGHVYGPYPAIPAGRRDAASGFDRCRLAPAAPMATRHGDSR